jgi:uncharacterized protein with GYD domain
MREVNLGASENIGGPRNLQNESGIQLARFSVATFVNQICGGKVGATHLEGRLAEAAEPQEGASNLKMADLANAIKAGKDNISTGTKVLAFIKSLFPGGESYDTVIAKKTFEGISSDMRRPLLELAFQAAASSGDSTGDLQALLNFCNAAKVDTNTIIGGIKTMSESNDRIAAFSGLLQANSGIAKQIIDGIKTMSEFNDRVKAFNELLQANSGTAKQVVLATLEADVGISELTSLPKFEGNAAKDFALELAKTKGGASILEEMIKHKKMDNPEFTPGEAQDLLKNLAENKGLDACVGSCLAKLLEKAYLPEFKGDDAKNLREALAGTKNEAVILAVLARKNLIS